MNQTKLILLIAQILLAFSYVGTCEGPRIISGKGDPSICTERWTTALALFIPSALGGGAGGGLAGHFPAGELARMATSLIAPKQRRQRRASGGAPERGR